MILVTGGTGLVGAHLLLQLVQKDMQVRAIYREPGTLDRVKRVFGYFRKDAETLLKKIIWVQADLNDLPALRSAMDKVTYVYHCAALISFDPAEFRRLLKVNTEGTANLVNLCIDQKVRKLCYVSSVATISKAEPGTLAMEEGYGLDRHSNVYAVSKYAAEMEVWRGSQEGLPIVIVNPGVILGPGFWDRGSGIIFHIAAKGKRYSPPGSAGFIDVGDLVQIMTRLMDATIQNERFIIIAENSTYKRMLGLIGKKLNRPGPEKIIPGWLLSIMWRADWLRSLLSGGRRKLTRSAVESFKNPTQYSNAKISDTLNYQFNSMDDTLDFCCKIFKEEHL